MKLILIAITVFFIYTKYQDKIKNTVNPLDQINIEYENKYLPKENIQEIEPNPTPIEEVTNTDTKSVGEIFQKNNKKNINNKINLGDSIQNKIKKISIKHMINDIKHKIQNGINKLKSYATINKQ